MTAYQNVVGPSLQTLVQPNLHDVVSQGFEYGVDFYSLLNGLRASFKKKTLYQDTLGELAVNELLQFNIMGTQDIRFANIIQKYAISTTAGIMDFLVYEHQQVPKSAYQGHTVEELRTCFEKALDDMVNGPFRLRLLQSHQYTHIAFASMQTGMKNEIFRVAALATKKGLTLEGIVQCQTGMRSSNGFIFIGKVLDITKKPNLLVLNRGTAQQIIVGPNRFGYNPEEGEFRVGIPEEYQGRMMSQHLPNSIIEVFLTLANDQTFSYGQGQDYPQNYAISNAEVGISDIYPDTSSPYYEHKVISRNDSMQTAFNMKDLAVQCGFQIFQQFQAVSNNQFNSGNASGPFIRTTKTQMLREQNAAAIKTHNQIPLQQNNLGNQIGFNRTTTNSQVLQSAINSVKPFTLKPSLGLINSKAGNENINPNVQHQPPTSFSISSNAPKAPQIPFKFSLNQPSQPLNTFQRVNTLQPPQLKFNFTNPTQSQTQSNGVHQQHQPFGFQQNTFAPTQFQIGNAINQPIQFNRSQTCNMGQVSLQAPQQPKIVFKFGNGGNSSAVSQQMKETQQEQNQAMQVDSHSQEKRAPVFNELSLIDQQTLQGYLKELQEDLTPEQLQRVTTLMLTDPVKFYEYFQIAHSQLLLQKNQVKKDTDKEKQKDETKKSELQKSKSIKLNEFDDLSLFLMIIPPSLIEDKKEKFESYLTQISEGKLSGNELIRKLIIRQSFPINESFNSMFQNARDSGDMILELKGEEFPCHKIVITATSDYFKKALKENEYINKYQYQIRGPYRQKLIVPDWIDSKSLKLFITYAYTGKVGNSLEGRGRDYIDPIDTINLLKVGNYFYHQYLQEQLIADVIIPNMNPQSAVLITKECYSNLEDPEGTSSQQYRKSCTFAWSFLYEYAQFYLQKHFSSLLRSTSKLAYELPGVLLRRIIDKSLLYVVDGGTKDLETILQFTADTWTSDRSISSLFKKSQLTMDACSAFNYQYIPQMGDFINQTDSSIDYQCRLVKDEDTLKPSLTSPQLSPIADQSGNNQSAKDKKAETDSTFYNPSSGSAKLIIDNGEEIDIASWKPSANIIKEISNTDAIFDKEPQYQTTIKLDDPQIKATFEKNKGMTVFSKAFDFGRRSWMLKIDLDSENNVSAFIVERGSPLCINQTKTNEKEQNVPQLQLGISIPIRFSSVLVQMEIIDPAFGDHKSIFFYSFAHDQNQVIGHDKILNLSQMQNRNELKIRVHMKEFLMHSALMWYLSQNFSELYSRDLKQMDMYKKNQWTAYTYNNGNGGALLKDYELLGLRFYNLYQLLSSSFLKVDLESTVLGFLYHYTKVQTVRQTSKNGLTFITDFLASQLRYYYLSTNKVLSALRDNEYLRQSKVFISRIQEEFQARASINSNQLLVLNVNSSGSQSSGGGGKGKNIDQPRKYYDLSKMNQEGRKKYEVAMSRATGQQSSVFIEELLEWLRTSKHVKNNSSSNENGQSSNNANDNIYAKQEIMKLQALYYEERRKCVDLQSNIMRLERRNEELEKLLGQDQWKFVDGRKLRRSFSNDYLRRGQTQIPNGNLRSYPNGGFYSPVRAQGNPVITNKDIMQAANKGAAAQANNNSFDQSVFYSLKNSRQDDLLFNDTYRGALGGSIAQADKKLIANQHADLTRLINKLDGNNKQQQPTANNLGYYANQQNYHQAENRNVPYYRQNRNQQKNGGEDECKIF